MTQGDLLITLLADDNDFYVDSSIQCSSDLTQWFMNSNRAMICALKKTLDPIEPKN